MFSGLFAIIQVMSLILYLFFEIPLANVWGHLYKKLRGQPRPKRSQVVTEKEVDLKYEKENTEKVQRNTTQTDENLPDTISHNTEL